MDQFEFDCPRDFTDLDHENFENNSLWFLTSHPFHEKTNSNLLMEAQETQDSKIVVPLVQFRKTHSTAKVTPCNTPVRKVDPSVPDLPTKLIHRRPRSTHSPNKAEQKDMLNLLRRHNERFVPPTKYEPSRHSVRDVRKWEKISGTEWATLTPEARVSANEEIMKMKRGDANRNE
jgi:hypothetical protein